MIHNNISDTEYYGVSHNDEYVLLCLGSGTEYVRLQLTPEQAGHIVKLLNEHTDKMKRGVWP